MSDARIVAVVVVSWNTRELLERCLHSLDDAAVTGEAEVWVVDNASSDGSAEMVRRRFPWAQVIASDENLGFGRAVNLAASRTRTPWIAAANADVELEPTALRELLKAGRRHPRAAALAPRLILPDGRTQHSVHPFPTLPFTLFFNSGLGALSRALRERLCLEGAWDPDRERAVPWAIAAFLLIRRQAFEEVGGFDEGQWMYAEDLDLGWRLRQSGWQTVYVPAARVAHRSGAATAQRWPGEADARWMTSTYAWIARRRGTTLTRTAAIVNIAGAGARALVSSILARAGWPSQAGRRDELLRWSRLHRSGLRSADELRRHR